jgi:Spy/CpxP family protein refolding chaperone
MARYFAAILLLTLLWSDAPAAAAACEQQRVADPKGSAPDARPPDIPRFKWWLRPDTRKDLRLTEAQTKKIDEIWESTSPRLREQWHELQKLQDALDKTFKENTADVATVTQQVERLERLRADNTATRKIMIYRMHLQLTEEQRIKVEAINAKLDEERKRRDEERKREGKGPGKNQPY